MPNRPMTSGQATNLAKLALILMACLLGVIVYVFVQSYEARQAIVHTQRLGCERGKKDRADNADFQTAHAEYITSVTAAASVKEDVKRAARKALKTYERTASNLRERSKINCKDVFPDTKVLP